MEAVPNFRRSARWDCRCTEMPQGRHRRSGNPAPIVAPDLSRSSEAHFRLGDPITLVPQLQRYLNLRQEGRGSRLMPCLQSTTTLPRPQLLPRFCSDVIAWYYFSLVKFLFPTKAARVAPHQFVNSENIVITF
jgi:hypothetical protein